MEIIIRGDKIEVTAAMKDYINEKLKRLEKYLESKGYQAVDVTPIKEPALAK